MSCLLCGNQHDCRNSFESAKKLLPGTPVRFWMSGSKSYTGRIVGVPSTGVSHWFVSIAISVTGNEHGRTMISNVAVPADYVHIVSMDLVSNDLKALNDHEFVHFNDDIKTDYVERLGWHKNEFYQRLMIRYRSLTTIQ